MSEPRIRVAHVIHSLGAGGAEAVLVELASVAPEAGLDLVVVGLSDADDARTVPLLRAAGATVHELHAGPWDLRAVGPLTDLLRRERVDVVHTHLKHADVVGALAARRLDLPVVSTLHVIESAPDTLLGRAKVRAAAEVRSRLADRVVVLSEAQERWYAAVARGRSPVVRIPNGVRDEAPQVGRDEVRASLDVPEGALLAVTVSLLRPEKGHGDLLDAVRLLDPDLPLVLALAGDGPLLGEVRTRVAGDPALASRVRVLGFRRDVVDLLAAADLVVHPSHADALPTAVISALAAGVPVVGTRVGGIPDLLTGSEGDSGLLVPPHDPAALAAATARLAADPELRERLGAAGRRKFLARLSATAWVSSLRCTYQELVKN